MPSYTESSSIFGSIMIMRTCSGVALYTRLKHHRVDPDGLAGAGGAGDQQVRHACEIRDHRHAADVLAERERERRADLVVGLGFDDLAQA